MRITELLDKRSIRIDGAPKSKNEALDQMVELMAKSGKINDLEAYRQEVYRREEEGTTGVGEGIAIPHGKGAFVDKPGLAAFQDKLRFRQKSNSRLCRSCEKSSPSR